MQEISSKNSAKYKQLLRLQKKRERDKTGLFIVEGGKEIRFALDSGLRVQSVWIDETKVEQNKHLLSMLPEKTMTYKLPKYLFERVCHKNYSEGITSICEKFTKNRVAKLNFATKSCLLILDNIQKPGNVGAMLRTADGAGVSGVILTNQKTDLYTHSAIRSSVGTFFTVPWQKMEADETLEFIKSKGFTIVTADPFTQNMLGQISLPSKMALVLGNEHSGLSDFWVKNSGMQVKIPMLGKNDSLNVSVSCAVLTYAWRITD